MKNVVLELRDEDHKRLKVLCARQGSTIKGFGVRAILRALSEQESNSDYASLDGPVTGTTGLSKEN